MATSGVEDDRFHSTSPVDSGNDQENEMPGQTPTKSENKNHGASSSSNAKDPSRPRRKKARRACYACQRAHLTCGDERPCQRCIKRGLQDVCQDGVRKKAKYLHDAPNEALLPGAANHYSHAELKQPDFNPPVDVSQQPAFFPPPQGFNVFPPNQQMPPPVLHERSMSTTSFNQTSPGSAAFNVASRAMQSPSVLQDAPNATVPNPEWSNGLFEAGDPALFNFDLASMNFGNHYGALEFGMLGHMATGAGETPESESGTQRGSVSQYQMPMGTFADSPNAQFAYSGDVMMGGEWSGNAGLYGRARKDGPHAFAIESNAHLTSPDTTSTPPDMMKFEDSPLPISGGNKNGDGNFRFIELTSSADNQAGLATQITTPQLKARTQLSGRNPKRPRDPSSIYTSVTSPYPYTAGFHQLIAYIQKRFSNSPSKVLAIAKSLASIRPSFIATNKTLNREDLIFMEKCFQRTLWEYEGYIEGMGTPTIVARRTGEIAAVGKEFQILTGWTKNVLLGRAPNLNVNRGQSGNTPAGSRSGSTGRTTGMSTPLTRPIDDPNETRQQPVFLAELLDDETIVQFYEDFARLAFGDSRGSVIGRAKLLKYRTKDEEIARANLKAEAEARGETVDPTPDVMRADSFAQTRPQDAKKGIAGEKGMQRLGSSDGKVDCAYCWTVKRDVFDIPMLIVINFLPCI